MRLQAYELEIAMNAGRRDRRLGRDAAHAPARGAIGRLGVQRLVNQIGQPLVVDGARLARAMLVVQAIDAPLDEATAPLASRRSGGAQALGDSAVGLARCSGASTMRARRASAAGIERERAIDVNCACSDSLSIRSAFGRPIGMAVSPVPKIPKTDAKHMPCNNGTGH